MAVSRRSCSFCYNATVDNAIESEYDASSFCAACFEPGYSLSLNSAALDIPPVSLLLRTSIGYSDGLNHIVAKFVPKYCPCCGVELIENKPFLDDFWDEYRRV